MKLSLFLAILFLGMVFPLVSFSAPIVEGVTMASSEAGGIVLSGVNFGKKSPAEPVLFLKDNINEGVLGANFSGDNWTLDNNPPKYVDSDYHSGKQSLLFKYTNGLEWSQILFDSNLGHEKLYITSWLKLVKKDSCTSFQWKSWRVSSSPGGYSISEEPSTTVFLNDNWYYQSKPGWGNNFGHMYFNGGKSGGTVSAPPDQYIFNKWQRVEQFISRGSAPSSADGMMWLRRVGRTGDIAYNDSYTTNDEDDGLWRYLIFGQAYINQEGCSEEDLEVYYDDIYVDNTLARVELGDNIDFNSCSKREIQAPYLWSSDSISVNYNQGSFVVGDSVYVFVVDDQGNPSMGFGPLTIGGNGEIIFSPHLNVVSE